MNKSAQTMSNDFKKNDYFGSALKRHIDFWKLETTDRPLFGCNIGFYINEHCPLTISNLPIGLITPGDISIDLFLEDCENLYKAHRQLADDYPFVASPFTYIPWMEAIMGCPIMASEASIWAEPCVLDWHSWEWQDSILHNEWAQKLFEILKRLVDHSAGRFPVSATLMRGPSDILAAMKGAGELPLDIMDYPDLMQFAVKKCADAFIEIGKEQHRLIPICNEGYMDGDRGFRVWAPEKVIWLQEDAMALLSPRIYRDFFLNEDRRICNNFPATAFHLHGSALWAIEDLIQSPDIDVVELNLESAHCDMEGTLAGWKKINSAKKALIIWMQYREDLKYWLERIIKEIPAAGLSIQVTAKDLDEAKRAKDIFFNIAQ